MPFYQVCATVHHEANCVIEANDPDHAIAIATELSGMDFEELGLTNGSETSVDSVELTDEEPAPYFYEILEGYATILSDAENHDRWSAENSRVGCSANRIASHEKESDGCDDLACVHRASLYLYSQALFNPADDCRGISWRRLQWANGATSENCSAARAMVANAPHCRQTFAVHHRGDTFNSWNRSFVVDLSGARPRHCKCEVLSMAVS